MAAEIEKQFAKIEASSWDIEFMNLKRRCDQESRDKQHTLEASKTLDNRRNNRYRDVNPYDHSRILLSRSAATDTDYINANLVRCERANRQYILTQGPLPLTVSHFWLMAWEQRSKAVLMLNKLVEKKAVKCHKYWPEEIGPQYKMHLNDVQLEVEYVKYEEFDNFSIRTLLLTDRLSGETREVLQFHYTTWPDFGIPSSPDEFLRFLKMVRDSGAMDHSVGPVIVHCSAGIGRSGTFCLVDCVLTMLEQRNSEDEEEVSVSDVLSELRSYRMGLIQTPDQLYFSYRAIIDGVKLFNDEDWCNTPISSTIKYCENGSLEEDDDDVPPPLPPPRSESLTTEQQQPPLPMIPIEEDEDDDASMGSETDVESCNSSNNNNNDDDDDDNERAMKIDEEEQQQQQQSRDQQPTSVTTITANEAGSPANGEDAPEDLSTTERDALRRRVREEKQQLMAEKVMDIKRKQREVEDGVVASKKRRSVDGEGEDEDEEEDSGS